MPSSRSNAPPADRGQVPMLARVLQLRSRAFKAGLTFLAVFIALAPFANRVFTLVSAPIIARLPPEAELIAKNVASPFLTPLKATAWVALFVSMPLLIYHVWRFVELWITSDRRRVALPFVIASALLFYTGVAFAYFLVLPMVFAFFAGTAPPGVVVMTDINAYVTFIINILLGFGLAFQVPIAIIIIVWTGLVSRKTLAESRPYVFLGAFVLGMLLTPPDVFSQTLLALPMYALFEAALFFCKRFLPENEAEA
jgi:sec-independent protein translocase protein TatC